MSKNVQRIASDEEILSIAGYGRRITGDHHPKFGIFQSVIQKCTGQFQSAKMALLNKRKEPMISGSKKVVCYGVTLSSFSLTIISA